MLLRVDHDDPDAQCDGDRRGAVQTGSRPACCATGHAGRSSRRPSHASISAGTSPHARLAHTPVVRSATCQFELPGEQQRQRPAGAAVQPFERGVALRLRDSQQREVRDEDREPAQRAPLRERMTEPLRVSECVQRRRPPAGTTRSSAAAATARLMPSHGQDRGRDAGVDQQRAERGIREVTADLVRAADEPPDDSPERERRRRAQPRTARAAIRCGTASSH